ncbi:hypothetical protein DFA_09672 [Cavenderia fasciculata]|uniref:FNIP repeat-containing protein n=1 Tax=Cavenderia fasciculata TaxID=261658 RepID=F4Q8A0_CACFS|nr:uncharacterized protein DFA_09672 [Cavenderia fasciculata]EGG16000.1 hypothetical protein DFA_09672 [Cavenderia fasciculata]|eukprot:XP_004352325.1 hypothetical protein DFA_09672 [Cavenderia fasciculata]
MSLSLQIDKKEEECYLIDQLSNLTLYHIIDSIDNDIDIICFVLTCKRLFNFIKDQQNRRIVQFKQVKLLNDKYSLNSVCHAILLDQERFRLQSFKPQLLQSVATQSTYDSGLALLRRYFVSKHGGGPEKTKVYNGTNPLNVPSSSTILCMSISPIERCTLDMSKFPQLEYLEIDTPMVVHIVDFVGGVLPESLRVLKIPHFDPKLVRLPLGIEQFELTTDLNDVELDQNEYYHIIPQNKTTIQDIMDFQFHQYKSLTKLNLSCAAIVNHPMTGEMIHKIFPPNLTHLDLFFDYTTVPPKHETHRFPWQAIPNSVTHLRLYWITYPLNLSEVVELDHLTKLTDLILVQSPPTVVLPPSIEKLSYTRCRLIDPTTRLQLSHLNNLKQLNTNCLDNMQLFPTTLNNNDNSNNLKHSLEILNIRSRIGNVSFPDVSTLDTWSNMKVGSIPSSVKIVKIEGAQKSLPIGVFPDTLEELHLDSFNGYDPLIIPQHLKGLSLLCGKTGFDQNIPNSLESLTLKLSTIDQPFSLPPNLKYLAFLNCVPKSFGTQFPVSVEELKVRVESTQYFNLSSHFVDMKGNRPNGFIPPSIKSIIFTSDYSYGHFAFSVRLNDILQSSKIEKITFDRFIFHIRRLDNTNSNVLIIEQESLYGGIINLKDNPELFLNYRSNFDYISISQTSKFQR